MSEMQPDEIIDYWEGLSFILKLTLVQCVYMTSTSFFGIILLLKCHQKFKSGQTKLSAQLKIHLYVWLTFLSCSFIYTFPILLLWRGKDTQFNLLFSSLKGALSLAALTISPISTVFLTIDRTISLTFPMMDRRIRRFYIQIASIIIMSIGFLCIYGLVFWRSYTYWNSTTTTCLTFGCLVSGRIEDIVTFKMVLGWLNIILGTFFFFVYYQYGKGLTRRRERKKNYVVVLVLCSELIFNVMTTMIYKIFYVRSSEYVSGIFGSILTPSHCTDGLFQSILLWKTWRGVNARQFRAIAPIQNTAFHNNTGSTQDNRT